MELLHAAKRNDVGRQQKVALVLRFRNEISVHTQIEEDIFYPAIRERVVNDHADVNGRLTDIAQQKHLPSAGAAAATNSQDLDVLRRLSGDTFDRAYATLMVTDHERVIDAFERELVDGTDSDVMNLVTLTLPALREHLSMARQLAPGAGA